ncbi:hypothetical protein FRC08_013262 [Ceratobasidium sp. 394]|nr:hypothetical protein FRC08_013262 [Ceratobasidium sp. 394]
MLHRSQSHAYAWPKSLRTSGQLSQGRGELGLGRKLRVYLAAPAPRFFTLKVQYSYKPVMQFAKLASLIAVVMATFVAAMPMDQNLDVRNALETRCCACSQCGRFGLCTGCKRSEFEALGLRAVEGAQFADE